MNFVYRLHGAGGEVIYVGRSIDVAGRIRKHNTFPRKPWIEDVRSVSMFGPMAREEAISAERQEIARLQPRGNIALTARDHRPFLAHRSAQAAASEQVAVSHWLLFNGDREVVGCHCGFRADESDDGWGDSVVLHLLNCGPGVARTNPLGVPCELTHVVGA